MIVRSSWLASMLCWSPNNDEDFPWRIPCACETSYPFINLDLGMHFLFPSTYPKLIVKLFQWLLSGEEYSCECLQIAVYWTLPSGKLPYNKQIHWLYGPACLISWPQDFFSVGWLLFILCPPTSQYSRSFGKPPSSYVQVRLAAGPQSHTFSGL